MKPEYIADESQIEAENDKTIFQNAMLLDHLKIINHALALIADIPSNIHHQSKEELVTQRLIIRCLNSGAACLKLMRAGYYQQALMLIRDIIETTFLLELFKRIPSELTAWMTLTPRDREKRFKPVLVRQKLDRLDGNSKSRRAEVYRLFSNYASHPTPEGFSVFSPGMMSHIGPFPEKDRVQAVLEELAKHISYTAIVCANLLPDDNDLGAELKSRFLGPLNEWMAKYMPSALTVTL